MKVFWLGHASFKLETGNKIIITDPFNEEVGYQVYDKEADYVTISHEHWDHNATASLKGQPQIINTLGKHRGAGIDFEGLASYHDSEQGSLRGANIIYRITAEGINLVHLGDLGHLLSGEEVEKLGKVDVLLIPVGGTFTIDAQEAFALVEKIKPKIVIPMHYQTPHLSFQLAPVEDFAKYFKGVTKKPYLEISKAELEEKETKVIFLDYLSWLT